MANAQLCKMVYAFNTGLDTPLQSPYIRSVSPFAVQNGAIYGFRARNHPQLGEGRKVTLLCVAIVRTPAYDAATPGQLEHRAIAIAFSKVTDNSAHFSHQMAARKKQT